MAEQAADPLAAGEASLASGDWVGARTAFEAALHREEAPAAREGLARALWWTYGPARAIAERTHAYSGYRRGGEEAAAARVALWIAQYQATFGNSPAAAGWLSRAAGLLEQLPEGADHVRLELVAASAETSIDGSGAMRDAQKGCRVHSLDFDRDRARRRWVEVKDHPATSVKLRSRRS
jgi:hypothetical protein